MRTCNCPKRMIGALYGALCAGCTFLERAIFVSSSNLWQYREVLGGLRQELRAQEPRQEPRLRRREVVYDSDSTDISSTSDSGSGSDWEA